MKYKLLYTVIIPILLLGCGDNEDSLSPSNIDRDWFIIEDNPNILTEKVLSGIESAKSTLNNALNSSVTTSKPLNNDVSNVASVANVSADILSNNENL